MAIAYLKILKVSTTATSLFIRQIIYNVSASVPTLNEVG